MGDSLEGMGFCGFFDVDNLVDCTRDALERSVVASCAMVVFVHDETCSSEWCRYEWSVAKKHKIPCLAVGDMHNCVKRTLLDQLHDTEPYLLSTQMIEYTLKNRRNATKEVALWLNDVQQGVPRAR